MHINPSIFIHASFLHAIRVSFEMNFQQSILVAVKQRWINNSFDLTDIESSFLVGKRIEAALHTMNLTAPTVHDGGANVLWQTLHRETRGEAEKHTIKERKRKQKRNDKEEKIQIRAKHPSSCPAIVIA